MQIDMTDEAEAVLRKRGGIMGQLTQLGSKLQGVATFAKLYFLPTIKNPLPKKVRLKPIW